MLTALAVGGLVVNALVDTAASIRIHRPLELDSFYAEPYRKDRGAEVLEALEAMIGDPA